MSNDVFRFTLSKNDEFSISMKKDEHGVVNSEFDFSGITSEFIINHDNVHEFHEWFSSSSNDEYELIVRKKTK